jgi:glycosyltransferase involved in cell wall biosynthesis
MTDYRKAYGLPERYFLSLGRMVEKKNLSTLVEAYARFARESVERSRAETGTEGRMAEDRSRRPNLNRRSPRRPEIAEGKLEVSETADGEDPHAGGQAAAATKTENRKLNTAHCVPALVFVGSGELERALREQARALGLRVVDRTDWKAGQSSHSRACETAEGKLTRINTDLSERLAADRTGGDASCRVTPAVGGLSAETADGGAESARRPLGKPAATTAENCKLNTEHSVENDHGTVFFYGFRQIEENAVFYALAEAFVLPSLKEEWGLVVNEAMAAGLPVIVSRTAGCAQDLLPEATASRSSQLAVGSKQPSVSNANENTLEERFNGFAFDPASADALATALRRVGETEPLRREMGKRSREVVAKFSCENFAKQALRAAKAASA